MTSFKIINQSFFMSHLFRSIKQGKNAYFLASSAISGCNTYNFFKKAYYAWGRGETRVNKSCSHFYKSERGVSRNLLIIDGESSNLLRTRIYKYSERVLD